MYCLCAERANSCFPALWISYPGKGIDCLSDNNAAMVGIKSESHLHVLIVAP